MKCLPVKFHYTIKHFLKFFNLNAGRLYNYINWHLGVKNNKYCKPL